MFFVSIPGGQSARKFEFSSSNRSRDMEGVPEFENQVT